MKPRRILLPAVLALMGILSAGATLANDREVRETREVAEARDNAERASREEADRNRELERREADRLREQERDAKEDAKEREDKARDAQDREEKEAKDKENKDKENKDKNGSNRDSGSRQSGKSRDGRSQNSGRVALERDARGGERVRGEVVVIATPAELSRILNAGTSAGFTVIERAPLESLDGEIVRIQATEGGSVDGLVDTLRSLAPASEIAPHHVYRGSGLGAAPSVAPNPPPVTAASQTAPTTPLGIVDTGVAAATPALRRALARTRGFATGGYVPRDHGTAVAAIAAHRGAEIISADVFGVDGENQPAATALALARAVDWLTASGVRVINMSIEGPDNPVLARVVRRALDAGVVLVAAAGNLGPAASASFPGGYPGVIAVTAVDARGRPYRRAGQGPHIAFAALGVDVAVPGIDGRQRRVSGTSFAAPVVAARALQWLEARPRTDLATLIDDLRGEARDLGPPGRDRIFGWGELRPALLGDQGANLGMRGAEGLYVQR